MNKLIKSLLLAISLVSAAPAFATTENYGSLFAGSFQPSSTFATLSVTGSGNVYSFTLTANNLNSIFNSGAFIGAVAVNTDIGTTPSISGVSGGSPVSTKPANGPGGDFDFWFDLTAGQAKLTANESVTWTATFATPVTFELEQFALHVQGLTAEQGKSGWYVNTVATTPVPEPETYGMMLAGLGLIGFMLRRRTN